MKMKELIPIDVRISMLQTCMNVSGNNFQGKMKPSKVLLNYAFNLYSGMMKQIAATEMNKLLQVKSTDVKKVVPRKKTNALLKKLAKSKKK